MSSQRAIMTYLLSKLELCILYDYLSSRFFCFKSTAIIRVAKFTTCLPLDPRKDGGSRERGLDY